MKEDVTAKKPASSENLRQQSKQPEVPADNPEGDKAANGSKAVKNKMSMKINPADDSKNSGHKAIELVD